MSEKVLDPKEILGQDLKKEREKRNITISELSKEARIPVDKLEIIEAGSDNNNNNNTMLRVYIIKYLKFLDMYNDKYKKLLEEGYSSNIEELTHTINLKEDVGEVNFADDIKRNKDREQHKRLFKLIVMGLIVLVTIGGLGYLIFGNLKSNVVDVSENETTLLTNTVLNPQEVIDTKPKIEFKETNNGYVVSGDSEYEVVITFAGQAYLEIPTQKDVVAKVYKEGEEVKFNMKADEYVTIYTGKFENIKITINGEELPLNDKKTGVQTFRIDFKKEVGDTNESGQSSN